MLPFEGVRVVEIGSGTALAFCGKLFSDFGAEVVKVEPPGGDPGRASPPLVQISDGKRESAYFAWLNTNKRSITADLESEEGMTRVRSVVAGSDIVLDARALCDPHMRLEDLHEGRRNPRLVEVVFTWFGESGPYSGYASTDAVCRALAGVIHSAGPVEGPPLIPHDTQSGVAAGLAAFTTAVAGLFGRDHGGRRYVLSVHEALVHLVEIDIGMALEGRHRPRSGINRFGGQYPASVYPTNDGWIGIFTVTGPQWRGLCKVLEKPELVRDPRYLDGAERLARADEIDAILTPVLATRSAAEWFERCSAERLPVVIVPTMEQLLKQAVHRERGAFVPVRIGEACFEGPILPQRMEDAGPLRGGRAPLAGEHDSFYSSGVSNAGLSAPPAASSARKFPLEGVRIVDLTMGWAGPFAARHLADLGAEVIKIESITYPDWWRGTSYSEAYYSEKLYEKATYFNMMNRNKLGVTLDLTSAEGVRILKELVASANAVIENYSAEVLPKLGLDYAALSKVNPNVVMLSMPAFGSNNAWSNTRAYGGTLEQASGLPMVSGMEDWPPTMTSYAYGDPIGGYNAAAALLTGLMFQKRTGKGRFIDMSQVEGMLSLVAPSIIEQSVNKSVGPRLGNRHPVYSPQGCFLCKDADDWIVIAVATDAQWRSLCQVIGRPDFADNREFDSVSGRRRHESEIEAAIGSWTRQRSADDAMALLQEQGVPAGAARSICGLLDDPHLIQRGFWQAVERPFVGHYVSGRTFFREDGEPAPIRNPAPTLGQHNEQVLMGMLGLTPDELAALSAGGVIGTEAIPKETASNNTKQN
jgi:crotonobetainyl-CoA:carnitine CoA-transferase CaiB-like acyl-CoA transferase